MNTPNNKRKKESMERIEKVFIELLQTKALNEISVSDNLQTGRTEPNHILRELYGYLRSG